MSGRRSATTLLVGVAGVAAVLLWGELEHWRSSRRALGAAPGPARREAVVVLGYRNRGRRANLLNRYRVRAGIRSLTSPDSVLVLSGGTVSSAVAEAELMADYARGVLGYSGRLVTETHSRDTWQNVQNVLPLIEAADRVKIVSNSLHAEKARRYLSALSPESADRLVRAADYRFGELTWLKPALAVVGLRRLGDLAPDSGGPPTSQ